MSAGQMLSHDWFPQPLPGNVVIGERSWCYSSFAFLHYRSTQACGVRVGHDSGIYHGTFFELGPSGEVEIGNYATLVGAIIATNKKVKIGDYAFISHEVILADSLGSVPLGPIKNRDFSGQDSAIVVGENVWIGARALLLSGSSIGEGAIIGAAAFVNFHVPPYAIVAGNPGRIVGWARE